MEMSDDEASSATTRNFVNQAFMEDIPADDAKHGLATSSAVSLPQSESVSSLNSIQELCKKHERNRVAANARSEMEEYKYDGVFTCYQKEKWQTANGRRNENKMVGDWPILTYLFGGKSS